MPAPAPAKPAPPLLDRLRRAYGSRPHQLSFLDGQRRCAVNPLAADHRRDDADRVELVRRAVQRVAVEDDEVGEQPRAQATATLLVAGEPSGRDGAREQRLLDRERLLGTPRGPLV